MVCNKQLSTGEELYVIDENKFVCKEDYLTSGAIKEVNLNSGNHRDNETVYYIFFLSGKANVVCLTCETSAQEYLHECTFIQGAKQRPSGSFKCKIFVFVVHLQPSVESISLQPCQMNASNIYLHRTMGFVLLCAGLRWDGSVSLAVCAAPLPAVYSS